METSANAPIKHAYLALTLREPLDRLAWGGRGIAVHLHSLLEEDPASLLDLENPDRAHITLLYARSSDANQLLSVTKSAVQSILPGNTLVDLSHLRWLGHTDLSLCRVLAWMPESSTVSWLTALRQQIINTFDLHINADFAYSPHLSIGTQKEGVSYSTERKLRAANSALAGTGHVATIELRTGHTDGSKETVWAISTRPAD